MDRAIGLARQSGGLPVFGGAHAEVSHRKKRKSQTDRRIRPLAFFIVRWAGDGIDVSHKFVMAMRENQSVTHG
jgi:hypothetical protein